LSRPMNAGAASRDRHHVTGQLGSVERDTAAARWNPADDRFECRCLAHAVAAEQRDGFARTDVQRDVAQDVTVAVSATRLILD